VILRPLEIIKIFDETIEPPHPKMVACIEGKLGFFFRVNSRPNFQHSLKLPKEPLHKFLEHDSYLECGCPLELDDYLIEESVRLKGIVGQVHESLIPEIMKIVAAERLLTEADKKAIEEFLTKSKSA
jgi:hypothetical protein